MKRAVHAPNNAFSLHTRTPACSRHLLVWCAWSKRRAVGNPVWLLLHEYEFFLSSCVLSFLTLDEAGQSRRRNLAHRARRVPVMPAIWDRQSRRIALPLMQSLTLGSRNDHTLEAALRYGDKVRLVAASGRCLHAQPGAVLSTSRRCDAVGSHFTIVPTTASTDGKLVRCVAPHPILAFAHAHVHMHTYVRRYGDLIGLRARSAAYVSCRAGHIHSDGANLGITEVCPCCGLTGHCTVHYSSQRVRHPATPVATLLWISQNLIVMI